ncbi:hypothetical protein Ljam_2101 [Legionella jamestowniensis]|uniref:Uncharacterized protein n=1 Tax=Legionella jamestowniensis TaxID=455 RepID=A0A0W0UJ18_9GAMM|nr:hypothetical protein Ljam_2101 [Legionella jamestowniensis]
MKWELTFLQVARKHRYTGQKFLNYVTAAPFSLLFGSRRFPAASSPAILAMKLFSQPTFPLPIY